jgi:hypothetical protein
MSKRWRIYKVVKETAKCCWIDDDGRHRLVRNYTNNRFAWPTREQAQMHFWNRMRDKYMQAQMFVNSCNGSANKDTAWQFYVTRNYARVKDRNKMLRLSTTGKGWVIDFNVLEEIANKFNTQDRTASLEDIEELILVLHKLGYLTLPAAKKG